MEHIFMLIRIASDIHLEQWVGRDITALEIEHLPLDSRDANAVLVLAGDISSSPKQLVEFIAQVEKRFLQVIFVAGNHCYYRHEMISWNLNTTLAFNAQTTRTSHALGEVGVQIVNNVRFIFATLWADGGADKIEQMNVEKCLWDFTVIKLRNKNYTVESMIRLHKKQKAGITKALKTPFDGQTIVVTHHMPSYRLCHPRFGNEINGGFASNCEDILAYDHAPDVWVFGHTHDVIDTMVFNTRCFSNPSGYRAEKDTQFNDYCMGPKFIEV